MLCFANQATEVGSLRWKRRGVHVDTVPALDVCWMVVDGRVMWCYWRQSVTSCYGHH